MLSFGMNYKLHYSLFQLFILMVTFKLGPYESTDDDLSSSVSGLAVMLTMLIGFAIISDDVSDPTYNIDIITFWVKKYKWQNFVISIFFNPK